MMNIGVAQVGEGGGWGQLLSLQQWRRMSGVFISGGGGAGRMGQGGIGSVCLSVYVCLLSLDFVDGRCVYV